MNRAERRKYKQGVPTEELSSIIRREQAALDAQKKAIIGEAVTQFSVAILLVLRDKLGFGRTRAQRFMTDLSDVFDAINEGYINFEEIRHTLSEEMGVEIQ